MPLPNLGSGSLVRLSLPIMNSATGSNSYGVGSGGYGAPAPRQDMEYLCAGDSIMSLLTLCPRLTFPHRLRCQKRNQVTRTHSMQGVWTSHNVQKEDQTECVYCSFHVTIDIKPSQWSSSRRGNIRCLILFLRLSYGQSMNVWIGYHIIQDIMFVLSFIHSVILKR